MLDFTFGDTTGTISHRKAGNQHLSDFAVVGDARTINGSGRGGDDYAHGVFAYGDSLTLTDSARGGDDHIVTYNLGTDQVPRSLGVGDADAMSGHAHGGNDVIQAIGGVDTSLDLEAVINELAGDGYTMSDRSRGGDDVLYGANNLINVMYGDAYKMYDHARGGDDVLVAGGSGSLLTAMYGDALWMADGTRGGNDTLISGASNDIMYGDQASQGDVGLNPTDAVGGRDTFVFMPNNGRDAILDFHHGEDKIDLRAFHFSGFDDLDITILRHGVNLIDLGSGSLYVSDDVQADTAGHQAPLVASDFIF